MGVCGDAVALPTVVGLLGGVSGGCRPCVSTGKFLGGLGGPQGPAISGGSAELTLGVL